MKKADKWDIDFVQRFLMTKGMGPLALVGEDATTWGSVGNPNGHSPDLVALRPRRSEDIFSRWAAKKAATAGVFGIMDSTVFRVTEWITSMLASLLLIASIVLLYVVQPMKARLGIIAGFSLLVPTCLITFARAKRSEVFAITAA